MAMMRQLKQHITVDVEKVELAKALEQLKRETATNIVLDAKAVKEGKTIVTLQIDDVPLETAVRLLAEMAGLKVVRNANVLYVTPRGNANELRKTGAAQGILDTDYGDVKNFRRFRDRLGARANITDVDEIVPADTLPLTEPLRPAAGKTGEPDPTPAPKDEEKKP
jgi:type II secretory pathway component GspD/PulD (secretin)